MTNHKNSELQLERIVFFSDAVFAIAITLLIIEIKVPKIDHHAPDSEFWLALWDLKWNLFGYFFSFFVIGAYWVGHHRIYGHIVRWNYGLIWRNILFLMAIGFMPFSTAFFTEVFPPRFVPLVLYASTFSIAGLLELWQWRYAVKKGLIDEELNPTLVSYFSWRMMSLPTVGIAAILIGIINPLLSGLGFMMMPLVQKIINSRFAIDTDKMEIIEDGTENED
ncbi:MAG TPA: TMEM175 family protein [Pyrinomonadaceae bacterium]|jgi:uncharacterized membrane protein|nr:TMEM175 family protein [Pyrinomonadaceae bacterium]